ncbi:MAG TPA: two-component system response regulator [Firmicutes bacterium]|jgi:two-component system, chemotaxis family, chemotaxis protein CheY|nr:two-component system response regulator [Bacillota bacterium]
MAQTCNVLVVDDSPMVFKAVKRALEPEGFQVMDQAFNGQEGLEKIAVLNPDVIILDVTMPIMDGIQTAEALFQRNPTAKVIMLSAMGDDDLTSKAKRMGVKLFLTKPFKPEELVSSIRSII